MSGPVGTATVTANGELNALELAKENVRLRGKVEALTRQREILKAAFLPSGFCVCDVTFCAAAPDEPPLGIKEHECGGSHNADASEPKPIIVS